MRAATTLSITLLLWSAEARADWPADVVISELRTYDGVRADAPTAAAYETLVRDLGVAVAHPASLPAHTTGTNGFDLALSNTFVFVDAYADERREPTPWRRAHPDGEPPRYQFVPGLTARKGLPWSTEIGLRGGWIGGSHQGVFGGFARVALLESYKPWPDLVVHGGYAAYLGNPELDVGTFDLGVTLGTKFAIRRTEGVVFSHWSPWADVSWLGVRAAHALDPDTAAEVGASDFGAGAEQGALSLLRLAGGFQVSNNRALLRLAGAWVAGGSPTLSVGFGFAL